MASLQIVVFVCLIGTCFAALPQCTTTNCTQNSDCPDFVSPNFYPACIGGVCTNVRIAKRSIGQICNTTDATSKCEEGLLCSAIGIDGGVEVCQHTRSFGCACTADSQCEGLLCLNGSCDAIRSIGDACTTDLHCGSVCVNSTCALGKPGDKCNDRKSCESGFCTEDNFCEVDTRANCSLANPAGRCPGVTSVCFSGQCFTPNQDVGASCNASVPFPQCKVTLACINSTCSQVAEGSPCSDRSSCSSLQDCVCGTGTTQYGCYTRLGSSCATAYQALDNCLSACSERLSEGIPNTCASKCLGLRQQYTCCERCATNSTFYNLNGTCPTLTPVSCCSSTTSCFQLGAANVCSALPSTTGSSTSIVPTSSPTPSPTTTGSEPASSSAVKVGVCAMLALVYALAILF